MKLKKVNVFRIMKVGKTQNELELSEDIIKESVIHHVFDNAPIVFNDKQSFTDYTDSDVVEAFINTEVIGVILPDTVDFNGIDVTADVMLIEEFANRTHFDNWCINYDKNKLWFDFNSCELFSKDEQE